MTRRYLAVGLVLVGCACEVHNYGPEWPRDECYYDHQPPEVPRGLRSVTGDGSVRLTWEPSPDRDVVGYGVYWNDSPGGYYERIAVTTDPFFMVRGLSNGRTYYFAVDAYDRCGNSSDLSYETVFDTPRPAGYGLRVWEASRYPNEAGIDFSRYPGGNRSMIVPWDDDGADIYLEASGGSLFLTAAAMDTDVLPWGRVQSLDEIDYAPQTGWVPGGSMMICQSCAYLVWTWDNHFAKVLVTRVGTDNVTLDWAYQVAQGNPELVPPAPGAQPQNPMTKPDRGGRGGRERS